MRRLLLFLLLLCVGAGLLASSGWMLIRDNPERSDAIVVLAGERTDFRYRKGLEMPRAGYGKVMLVDAQADYRFYGHTPAEYAASYIQETAGPDAERVKICDTYGDGTQIETAWVAKCMEQAGAHSALIVTSDFHTRRALS